VAITRITRRQGRFTVYNFEVARTHTYFAGGWWVHNLCPPGWVVDKGTFISWVKQLDDKLHTILSTEDANQLVSLARSYGATVEASANDLAGHPNTNWPTPHIHIGEKRFHVGVPDGYVLPP
jgi:hypothetical protein